MTPAVEWLEEEFDKLAGLVKAGSYGQGVYVRPIFELLEDYYNEDNPDAGAMRWYPPEVKEEAA